MFIMASLIPGYEYDIFISYRQKDNKGDRWVSEFVEALKAELESTFKEEISIYFDINPSDYLLESYDVDASLKRKLKCLIFIPVISRTYCDPKSFAWDHEFKSFIEQASQDQYGLKVTLPNGNVATRVLPVKIHDLDADDMKLCESVTGGFLRGVEFIYKEPGVNRPLKPDDDEKINLNKTKYRNQINKVALAVKDIIESMKFPISHEMVKGKETQIEESKREFNIKEPGGKEIVKLKQEVGREKIKLEKGQRFQLSRKSGILISGILVTIVILMTLIFLFNRHSKIKWAKEVALTEIEQHINKANIADAIKLVQKAGKYISNEPKFQELSTFVTSKLNILTDPPGADVYIKEYSDIDAKWEKIGRTPIDSAKFLGSPYWQASSIYLLKIVKSGYETVFALISTSDNSLHRKLFKQGTIPSDMVYVEGQNGFFIDRYEVTNKQYKEFIDKGGYRNPDYWKSEFKKDGKTLRRDEAMTLFTDNTGRPGPLTWVAGDYPEGQDNFPVSGISWYEAAAYAEYAGKSLPTSDHWESAAGEFIIFSSKIIPLSNFKNKGPEPVRKCKGITRYGAYDMAGNVREWCWNETPAGHIIRGGAWNDANYLYSYLSQLPSIDRSPKNGFRCVQYIDKEKIPESAFQKIEDSEGTDFSKVKPVDDNIFTIYKNQFLYDKTALDSKIEKTDNSNEDWTIERITYNSAYGKERVIAYLFLPKISSPPFQTLILFPGMDAITEKDLLKDTNTKWWIDYLLKSGHAVMCPIYKGTFDRIDEQEPVVLKGYQIWEWIIKWVKDFSRSIDYLETRPDIDISKIGYYGFSLGGLMGGIIPAVEDRLKVNILILAGLKGDGKMVSYVSRIKIPTLMLNGKYDYTFPLEKSARQFYDLLGTTKKDLILYDTDHYVPQNEMIKEVLSWCDNYLGPVKFKNQ
jgi:eukaryotic-like serine/threonine-protein kinase